MSGNSSAEVQSAQNSSISFFKSTLIFGAVFTAGLFFMTVIVVGGIYADGEKSRKHHTPAFLYDLYSGRSYQPLTDAQMKECGIRVVQDLESKEFRILNYDEELPEKFMVININGHATAIEDPTLNKP